MKQGQRLHAAQSSESSSPDSVLNIVITINVWKSPIKIKKKYLQTIGTALGTGGLEAGTHHTTRP